MHPSEMPQGTTIGGYKGVSYPDRSNGRHGFSCRPYRDGDPVAADEEVIDYMSITRLPAPNGDLYWMQEPGGQRLSDDEVAAIIAAGAVVRLR